MTVPSYEQLLAENERLREEGRKDYEGMREFQQKYIAADQELRKLRAELDALKAWKAEPSPAQKENDDAKTVQA